MTNYQPLPYLDKPEYSKLTYPITTDVYFTFSLFYFYYCIIYIYKEYIHLN